MARDALTRAAAKGKNQKAKMKNGDSRLARLYNLMQKVAHITFAFCLLTSL